MKSLSNTKQASLMPHQVLTNCHRNLGRQAYLYVNEANPQTVASQEVLNRSELINRISQSNVQDDLIELSELIRDVEQVCSRNIKLTTLNGQYDIIANEETLVEVLKYMFANILMEMKPEMKFSVGYGMGSVQLQFSDELSEYSSALELVEQFMKKERGYVWMVGKTLHLVFQVHNKLMAA